MEGDTLWVNYTTSHFSFAFNGFLKVAFQGSRITSDAVSCCASWMIRLGLATLISDHLTGVEHGSAWRISLRQSSRLAGYEDLNDAVRVSADPIGSSGRPSAGTEVSLTSTLHWRQSC